MIALVDTERRLCSSIRMISVAICLIGTAACSRIGGEGGDNVARFDLTSSSLAEGLIPKKHTCDGEGVSPALSWAAPPTGTQSYVLIMDDIDTPRAFWRGRFVHWVLFGLAADKRELPEGVPQQAQLADGTRQGNNGIPTVGYAGPCPPGSSPHRYAFSLYALDSKLELPAGASARDVRKALQGHVIGKGQLVASYRRSPRAS
jgi:Raf kinase inhibitor-like YbhB/YbcL family protein